MTKKSMLILSFLALAMTASAQIDKGDDGFGQRSTTLTMTKKEPSKVSTTIMSYLLDCVQVLEFLQ